MTLRDLTQEQRALADFISGISQRTYRAKWMQGIERDIWSAMHTPGFGSAPLHLTAEEVQQLYALSAKCGGWIVFDDIHEESFVPIKEFDSTATAAAQETIKRSQMVPLALVDQQRFADALLASAEPTDALVRAFKRRRPPRRQP